jgi:hypothetical protein
MPASNPTTSSGAASQPQIPDTQTLIALLGNLVPLLTRLQQQSTPFGLGPFSPSLSMPNPALDQQAAITFVEDITAESVRALSSYLETHSGRFAGLDSCQPIVTRAAQCRLARDYAQAFDLIWQVYRVVAALRAANPEVPPIRRGGQDDPASAQSAAMH